MDGPDVVAIILANNDDCSAFLPSSALPNSSALTAPLPPYLTVYPLLRDVEDSRFDAPTS
jgi:hypothetical protein